MTLNSKTYRCDAIPFQTYSSGRPRTCGVVVRDSSLLESSGDELAQLANHNSRASAGGKVVLIDRNQIFCYQVDEREGRIRNRVFCGNASCAAIAIARLELATLQGPRDQYCTIKARIEGQVVSQSWAFDWRPTIDSWHWNGLEIIESRFLNHYFLVRGPLPVHLTHQDVLESLAGDSEESCKLAILQQDRAAEFYCRWRGKHGAIPITGLATLALAASYGVWWLSDVQRLGIRYRERASKKMIVEPLPKISYCGRGLKVWLPSRQVHFYQRRIR